MADEKTGVQNAADALLNHVNLYVLADRIGEKNADMFIAELVLISDGKVRFGALVGAESGR